VLLLGHDIAVASTGQREPSHWFSRHRRLKAKGEWDDYLAARLESAIARLRAEGNSDQQVNTRYAAIALGGMVARFAEMMFIGGQSFDLNTAVEQLTLLWSNALGIKDNVSRSTRAKDSVA
jgi:hypothetical protein